MRASWHPALLVAVVLAASAPAWTDGSCCDPKGAPAAGLAATNAAATTVSGRPTHARELDALPLDDGDSSAQATFPSHAPAPRPLSPALPANAAVSLAARGSSTGDFTRQLPHRVDPRVAPARAPPASSSPLA